MLVSPGCPTTWQVALEIPGVLVAEAGDILMVDADGRALLRLTAVASLCRELNPDDVRIL